MLELYFFNVGHGDSIAIKFPNGEWGVIDCNRSDRLTTPNVLTFLTKQKIKHLKFVCITHPHIDHFDGIDAIVDAFDNEIDDFIFYDRTQSTFFEKTDSALRRALKSFVSFKKKRMIFATNEKIYKVGDIDIKLCNPTNEICNSVFEKFFTNKDIKEYNKLSVVMYFEYKGIQILLNADVPFLVCKQILNVYPDISADILKVSHHGARADNPDDLLLKICKSKSIAVLSSAGGKVYKNSPHPDVIKYLKQELRSNVLDTSSLAYRNDIEKVPFAQVDGFHSEDADEPATDGYFKITVDEHGEVEVNSIPHI